MRLKSIVFPCLITMSWTGCVLGQTTGARPKFEAAVVKVNKSGDTRAQGSRLHGGQLSWHNLTLRSIMGLAFVDQYIGGPGYLDDEFVGTPDWFSSDRFDLIATSPSDTSVENIRLMLQDLLFERFKLVIHREPRRRRVWALTAGKQVNLSPAGGAAAGQKGCVPGPDVDTLIHKICTTMTMPDLAQTLPQIAPLFFTSGPVLDMTDLKGTYDFKLDWVGRVFSQQPAPGAAIDPATFVDRGNGPTLFDSIEKLGLKLEERQQPHPTIVIDHLERIPSEN